MGFIELVLEHKTIHAGTFKLIYLEVDIVATSVKGVVRIENSHTSVIDALIIDQLENSSERQFYLLTSQVHYHGMPLMNVLKNVWHPPSRDHSSYIMFFLLTWSNRTISAASLHCHLMNQN